MEKPEKNQENKQKIKLLVIAYYLRRETSEENPVTTPDLCGMLLSRGIKCDRRTLYQDIELLEEFGFPMGKKHVGHAMGYYYKGPLPTEMELRFLYDAVEAANFLPREKADALQNKIARFSDRIGRGALLEDSLHFNRVTRTEESVFDNVKRLGDTIVARKRLGFRYFDLNENRERVFRKLGRRYLVDPIALVYNESNYYLTVYSEKYDAFNIYRVDRMADIEMLPEPVSEKAISMRGKIGSYTAQMFRMFGGEPADVSLRFPDKLLGAVYDKFGMDVQVTRLAENVLEAESTVQLSPTFYGWVFQFGGEMRITGPGKAVREYRKVLKKTLASFSEEE